MIVFLGPPGCGKGTQASLLCKNFGYNQVSSGDLLKARAKETLTIVNMGELVSDDVVFSLITQEISRLDFKKTLLDGFPRTLEQAQNLDCFLKNESLNLKTIIFELNNEILLGRVLGRVLCVTCGAIYHDMIKPAPSKCHVCGNSDFKKRIDDNQTVFLKRVDVYQEHVKPIMEFYKDRLFIIDASKSIDNVYKDVVSFLNLRGE